MLGKEAVLAVPSIWTRLRLGVRRREKEIFSMESAGSQSCPFRRNRRGEVFPSLLEVRFSLIPYTLP